MKKFYQLFKHMLNNLKRREVKEMDTQKGIKKVLEACCCDCDDTATFTRRFVTAQEELEKLENYRNEIKKELAGVEQRIQELKSK